jgi:hypothetical protein
MDPAYLNPIVTFNTNEQQMFRKESPGLKFTYKKSRPWLGRLFAFA